MKIHPLLRTALAALFLMIAASLTHAAKPKKSAEAKVSGPAVGETVEIKFTDVHGKSVDLASLKGKVVLVDFWATWCGPCVGEIPHVLKAYEKLHAKGFEIIGISLDSDKAKLTKFTKEKGMTWPQYFDGQGWNNKLSSKFGIHSIPAMWLIGKDGKIATTNARDNLVGEVEQLLAK